VASKNAHLIVKKFDNRKTINAMWLFSGVIMIILSFFLGNIFIVFAIFLIYYIFLNIRRPLMVELVGEASEPGRRASVLSVESQMTSLLVAIFAPILGFIADRNMSLMFILVGTMMISIHVLNLFINNKKTT
jgi:predicted MFS family arabinose efflux permease